jgi:hypothetical protein
MSATHNRSGSAVPELLRTRFGRSSQQVPSAVGRQRLAVSRAATLPRSLENTNAPSLQFRARVSVVVEHLITVHNSKMSGSLTFSALLSGDGVKRLELARI